MKKIGTVYKGKQETQEILFSRVWAMPNAWTFKIGPIAHLLKRYVPKTGGEWLDPFAGMNSPAQFTNDMNPEMAKFYKNAKGKYPVRYHYTREALDFAKLWERKFNGILFDPPYSFRQISEHYKGLGQKATQMQTSMAFYEKVKSALCELVVPGGYVISFGWNSNGFGKRRGFKIVEIMMVAHGGSKNDTIVTVEQKI